jgi:radical SAM superfamily enzyme YgiQ (UPF0313 family)
MVMGTHASALPKQTQEEGSFDYVCQGEGPTTIKTLLENWQENLSGLNTIGGLWKKGAVNTPHAAPNIEDLDRELPAQAWDLLDMKRYQAHNWHLWTARYSHGGYASVQTSLGCPFRCTFCCINAPFGNAGIRYWSAENVVDQIEYLYCQYGISNIKIPDEMFCLNKSHVFDICQLINQRRLGQHLNMWAYARVDTVKDDNLLNLMHTAGFRWLGIGIESGSKHVRDGVEKGRFDDTEIALAVKRVHRARIGVAANYIFGLPDDTRESMQQTYELACKLNTEWANFYCAMAYPGSALHKEAKTKGWKLPEDEGGPGWIGYSQHAYEAMPLSTETVSYTEVLDIRDAAFLNYFSRPEYQDMAVERFGPQVHKTLQEIFLRGKLQRKHRKEWE